MTARVSAQQVKEIIDTSIADDIVLTNHIDTANLLVTETLGSTTLTARRLEKIELYLAAHFVALTEERGGITRSELGDAEESYANIYSAGFQATRYGQAAMSLDSTGTLNALGSPKLKAEFRVV